MVWKLTIATAAVLGVGGALYFSGVSRAGIKGALKQIGTTNPGSLHPAAAEPEPDAPQASRTAGNDWDGLVPVSRDEQAAIGFRFVPVQAQTVPMKLDLTGRTAYDTDTITKVRPRFDARVEKVFAVIGQRVKKGDPLVELYSSDLAQAKSDYQTKFVQWQHDKNLYNAKEKLVITGAISLQAWVDIQNDEMKSRLDYNLGGDRLRIFYEIPKAEIDPLLDGLKDKTAATSQFGTVSEKAKITLRAKTDGYLIARDVVKDNFYQETDVLMEIAPLDHLWVWVNVYELDQDKVFVGQTIEMQFPFLQQTISGKINYVAPEVSKDTRAVKIRASIPNPEARLKSDMLINARLEIPPVAGQTIIPRLAMVVTNGGDYVFVRRPSEPAPGGGRSDRPGQAADKFERVRIRVAQENTDFVVVASGLRPGQEVVTNGSLILTQLYEDQRMTVTGLPAQ